jgi:hypothetical protein
LSFRKIKNTPGSVPDMSVRGHGQEVIWVFVAIYEEQRGKNVTAMYHGILCRGHPRYIEKSSMVPGEKVQPCSTAPAT